MYSIEQSQCFDFLLKTVVAAPISPLHTKAPKLVVDINGRLWCGDFVRMSSNFIVQPYIDSLGDIEDKYFTASNSDGIVIFRKASEAFSNLSVQQRSALRRVSNLSFLFNYLHELVSDLDMSGESSPIYAHLLNAKSLNDELKLPFISLTGEDKIKLMSIIETEN
ncbi:hypothetical protein [Enterobacter ludwigii]|uniref:hypothetical protein n=1 Tax=Enterobacter ludwigii TaxID=299767 RepID=UPI003F6F7FD8